MNGREGSRPPDGGGSPQIDATPTTPIVQSPDDQRGVSGYLILDPFTERARPLIELLIDLGCAP